MDDLVPATLMTTATAVVTAMSEPFGDKRAPLVAALITETYTRVP